MTDAKTPAQDLTALGCARICHDLVNPLGAIGNGLELLQLTTGDSEEMRLIADAVDNATARLNLFRVAFGVGETDRALSRPEIGRIFEALSRGGRIELAWLPAGESTRAEGKRVFLAVLCAETALPMGGRIIYDGGAVRAETDRLRIDPALWEPLRAGRIPDGMISAQVQFGLLPVTLAAQGLNLSVQIDESSVTIGFGEEP